MKDRGVILSHLRTLLELGHLLLQLLQLLRMLRLEARDCLLSLHCLPPKGLDLGLGSSQLLEEARLVSK